MTKIKREYIEAGLLLTGALALVYLYLRSKPVQTIDGATPAQQASGSFAVPSVGGLTSPARSLLDYNYPAGAAITIPGVGTVDGGAPLISLPPVNIGLGGSDVFAPNTLSGGDLGGSFYDLSNGAGGIGDFSTGDLSFDAPAFPDSRGLPSFPGSSSSSGGPGGSGGSCNGCCSLPTNSGDAFATPQQAVNLYAQVVQDYPRPTWITSYNESTAIGFPLTL